MPSQLVTQKSNTEWSVQSTSGKQEYAVVLENKKCPVRCHLVCMQCTACIHTYSCTCMDYIINHTMCKHIHLVSINRTHIAKPSEVEANNATLHMDSSKQAAITHHVVQDDNIRKIKDRLHQALSKIHICIEKCMSAYDLQMAESHVNSAAHILALAETVSKPTFFNKSIHPVNSLVERQRFHSTRKKKKVQQHGLLSPLYKKE